MSKLHITLAENMSRFGTKNLTEANKRSLQYLAEQGNVPGKKPVSTTTPVTKPAVNTNTSASNYTPYVDAATQIGRGYTVTIPLGSEARLGASVLGLSDSTNMRNPMLFKNPPSSKYGYVTYAVVGGITIDLAKGTLIHQYHYQYGQDSGKPLQFTLDKKTGQQIGHEYSYEKTYKFVAGNIADFNKQLTTLKPVLDYIISSGPVKAPNVGKLTNNDFYEKMKSFGYTATFKGV